MSYFSRRIRATAPILTAILVLCTWFLWRIYITPTTASSNPAVTSVPQPNDTLGDDVSSPDMLVPATGLDLFGRLQPPAPLNSAALPETGLDLQLVGILAIETGGNSRALIAQRGKKATSFSQDEEVMPGVTLHQIGRDHVVIKTPDDYERLQFDRTVVGQRHTRTTRPQLRDLIVEPPSSTSVSNSPPVASSRKNTQPVFLSNASNPTEILSGKPSWSKLDAISERIRAIQAGEH